MFPDPQYLGVKICGITQEQQAREIIALGADALGINFWPKSKRYHSVADAATWLPDLKGATIRVAVLVNPDHALLDDLLGRSLVDILQLHGDESPALVAELMQRGVTVIKALQVRDRESLRQIADFACETILLDAYNPGVYGGTGHSFPWELATLARETYPEKRFLLSGGLTAANVHQAVQQTRPAAVDVASGVEISPGIKDLEQVRRFIDQARSAASAV
jgi:phosphoribosylanthranilate isomerase